MKRNYIVTVKESEDGQPWLLVELHEDIGMPDDNHQITFQLDPGATMEDAESIKKTLNSLPVNLKIAKF